MSMHNACMLGGEENRENNPPKTLLSKLLSLASMSMKSPGVVSKLISFTSISSNFGFGIWTVHESDFRIIGILLKYFQNSSQEEHGQENEIFYPSISGRSKIIL
ncbi:hypothetical protein Dimus_029150 [Dionaea muscipula]